MVGAGGHAVAATETPGIYLTHNPGFMVVIRGHGRAYRHARRMAVVVLAVALHARHRDITDILVRKRPVVAYLKNPDPVDAVKLPGLIGFKRHVVFRVAGHHAGPAPGTLVKVNDHAVPPDFFMLFVFRHLRLFFKSVHG